MGTRACARARDQRHAQRTGPHFAPRGRAGGAARAWGRGRQGAACGVHLLCSITFRTLTCRYSPLFAACSAVGHPPGLSCPNRSHYTGDRDSTAPGCRWPYRQPTPSRACACLPGAQPRLPSDLPLGPRGSARPRRVPTQVRARGHAPAGTAPTDLICPRPSAGPCPAPARTAPVRRGGVPRAKHASSTRQSVADADGVRDRGASEAGRRGRRAPHLLRVCPLLTPFHSPPPSLPTPPVSPLLLLSAALESGYRQVPRTGHAGGPQNPLVRWPRCTRKSAGSTRWTSPRGTGRRREVRLRLRRVRCVRACAALGSAVCGKGVCAQCARSAHAPCTRAAVAWAELGGASRERESAPPTRARR